ncbi:MAG: Ribosomal RNA small subunit methyltransferase A [Chlamydiales bacterium]|nr:Ribosomal RNA small subunit methyltransferase A [Chlamydiales bacterium]
MDDYLLFVKRFFSNPSSIGSLFPSSKKLAERITKKGSAQQKAPRRYLEVGAGSGAVTQNLIKQIRTRDTLDIVELDAHFCKRLRKKYGHLPNVFIHERSILSFEESHYDVVVSSLPLNSFDSSLVDQILLKYKSLVKAGGYVSFFEYIGLSRIKNFYLSGSVQVDFKTILSLKNSFVDTYCTDTDKIWWNIPPARVFHCQI